MMSTAMSIRVVRSELPEEWAAIRFQLIDTMKGSLLVDNKKQQQQKRSNSTASKQKLIKGLCRRIVGNLQLFDRKDRMAPESRTPCHQY
ncbi:hypothetical protein TYRP_004931 [Tyrophagus putrescentiae]|nr:hypothetical protein TYRP_004931 [Tyrophagus putrescentiae]